VPTRLQRYDGAIHGFFAMGLLSAVARTAIDDAAAEVKQALA
jgi:acetyl esterase/lipase